MRVTFTVVPGPAAVFSPTAFEGMPDRWRIHFNDKLAEVVDVKIAEDRRSAELTVEVPDDPRLSELGPYSIGYKRRTA